MPNKMPTDIPTDMLITAATALVKCGFAMESTIVEIEPDKEIPKILVKGDNENVWVQVVPFADTLNGRQQFDALIGHYMISTVVDVDIGGWWVECYTPGLCTIKNQEAKDNQIVIAYPVKYEGKYRREAEMRCLGFCLGAVGIPK